MRKRRCASGCSNGLEAALVRVDGWGVERVANPCRVVDLIRSADGSLKATYVGRLTGRDATRDLERAGYSVARIRQGDMVSVELAERLVWLDVGYTVRVLGDSLDPEGVLFQAVCNCLDASH